MVWVFVWWRNSKQTSPEAVPESELQASPDANTNATNGFS
jgi:hypothetical protein